MDLAELRRLSIFDGLDDAQLSDLLAAATGNANATAAISGIMNRRIRVSPLVCVCS